MVLGVGAYLVIMQEASAGIIIAGVACGAFLVWLLFGCTAAPPPEYGIVTTYAGSGTPGFRAVSAGSFHLVILPR